jgi:hypothetical protein
MYRLPAEMRERLADEALARRITAEGLLREIVGDFLGIPVTLAPRKRWLNDEERRRNHVERQMAYLRRKRGEQAS